MTNYRDKSEIAREIMAYLAEHPDAQDTLDGIVQWWLLEQRIQYQKTMVKETLGELVKTGFIVEYQMENSLTSYRVNQGKKKEIEEFLKNVRAIDNKACD
jgi:hypothetical protein